MYIYQLDRALLVQQVHAAAHYLHGRVLDVGSGTFARYKLPESAHSCVRMDVAPGPNVDVVGRAESIPFPDASFDSVISTQVLEHVEEPERVVQEINRILKKGGHALITVPQWNELHEEPYDYWRYTCYGLQTLFERHEFELVGMEQRGGYHSLHAQLSMRFLIDFYHLHNRPIVGRIMSRVFRAWGTVAIWRDARDHSPANRKHTIGWCAVFRKI